MTRVAGRYVALALLVGVFGCRPSTTAVRVDIDRILNQESARLLRPVIARERPPTPAVPVVATLPARAEESIRDASHASKDSIEARVVDQQRRALATFENRLRTLYETRIDAYRVNQEQAQSAAQRADYAAMIDRIHQLFLQYASERRPKVLRFALLVGYPDPNPTSAPPRAPLSPYAQKRFDEAKEIREDLAELDRKFDQSSDAILRQVTELTAQARARMETRIAKFRDEQNARAGEVAEAEVRVSAKDLGLSLIDPTPVILPALPARRVAIAGEPPLPPAPQVPSEQISRGPADRRSLLEHELSIWLALNRYRQAAAGRDVTEEFRKWRETYQGGP